MHHRSDPPPSWQELLVSLSQLEPISELHVIMLHCGMPKALQPSQNLDQQAQALAFLEWAQSHDGSPARITQELVALRGRSSPEALAVPGSSATRFLLPQIPPHFVPRPEDLAPLVELVLAADESAVGVTSAAQVGLHGKGGVGKTALMIALGHDRQVRARFRDGVCWLAVGQAPKLESLQAKLLSQLLGRSVSVTDVQEGRAELQAVLGERSLLILLDDVWDAAAVAAFQVQAANCRLVFTTRDRSIARDLGVRERHVGDLPQHLALQLLAEWAGSTVAQLPPLTEKVAQRCGYSPLALKTCGAFVRDGDSWDHIYQLLCAVNLAELRKTFPDYAYLDLYGCVEVGVKSLANKNAAHAARYRELAVFLEDVRVPEVAVQALWKHTGQLSDAEAGHLVTRLVSLSLLESDGQSPHRTLQLHDVQRDYLRGTTPNMPGLHEQLIESYRSSCRLPGDWSTGPQDGYFDVWISEHFRLAGWQAELRDLLGNYAWLRRRVEASDVASLLSDYQGFAPEDELQAVAGALRLSSHVLTIDPQQLPSQLWGRLAGDERQGIVKLLSSARSATIGPWLRPRFSCFEAPGGTLIGTLHGHQDWVNAVSVYQQGDAWRAVSASGDKTLKVWDLTSGRLRHNLDGHHGPVTAVSVYEQGGAWRAVSASADWTLKVWDLETGRCRHDLVGHLDAVTAVSVYEQDGAWRAVSASLDQTLRTWDLDTGTLLHDFEGYLEPVTAVSVYEQGGACHAVSASADSTLKVWNLETGRLQHNLPRQPHWIRRIANRFLRDFAKLHKRATYLNWLESIGNALLRVFNSRYNLDTYQFWVHAVSVYRQGDAWRAVSASRDKTLKVWDLETGRLLHNLEGHQGPVTAVSVYEQGDGWRAVSASSDHRLKVWDLETGTLLQNLKGDTAVSIYKQGGTWCAITASNDKTLKVWDLETGTLRHSLEGHQQPANVVAVYEHGSTWRAVSASWDQTLKMWDLEGGRLQHDLKRHQQQANVVSVYEHGGAWRAISASRDKSLKVWGLESGQVLHNLEGHLGPVIAVSVYDQNGELRAVSASWDQTLKVWDLETGALRHNLEGHRGPINAVSVYVQGSAWRAVSASWDRTLKVWDLETGRILHDLERQQYPVNSVSVYKQNGAFRAASASRDYVLQVWDLEDGQLHDFEQHNRWYTRIANRFLRIVTSLTDLKKPEYWVNALSVYEHAGAWRAISASDGKALKLWDLENGSLRHGLEGHQDSVSAVAAFQHDGAWRAVSASSDHTLILWDLEVGRLRNRFKGHQGPVTAVSVYEHGDSWRAVSASEDQTLKLWDLKTGNLIANYHADGTAKCIRTVSDKEWIIAGDQSGKLHFLAMENSPRPASMG